MGMELLADMESGSPLILGGSGGIGRLALFLLHLGLNLEPKSLGLAKKAEE